MNPHSAAVAGSGNPLKSRFESEIRAKIFAKSADPFAYSPHSLQAEITLKSPFLCVNRSLIWCVFLRGPAKELSGKLCEHMKVEMISAVKY